MPERSDLDTASLTPHHRLFCDEVVERDHGLGHDLTKTDFVETVLEVKSRKVFAKLINIVDAFHRKENLGGYPITRMLYEEALCSLVRAQLSSLEILKIKEMSEEVKEPTFGETLVGKSFNPSGDDKIAEVKALFAKATDLLIDSFDGREVDPMERMLTDIALGDILKAQMMVVKVLTLKK